MPENIPTLPEIYALVQRWASANGITLSGITLNQANGVPLPLQIGPSLGPAPGPAVAAVAGVAAGYTKNSLKIDEENDLFDEVEEKVSADMLFAIFDALPEPGQPPITFDKLKNQTGYGSRSRIYAALRRLEELGKLSRLDGKFRKASPS
jgi:hypothetical protein